MSHILPVRILRNSVVTAAIAVAGTIFIGGSASATTMPAETHHDTSVVMANHQQPQHHEWEKQQHEQKQWHHEQVKAEEHARHEAEKAHQQQLHHDEQMRIQAEAQHHDKMKHDEKVKHSEKLQASIDLRVGLNNLLREHVTTNLTTNRSIVTGASQAEIDAGVMTQIANADALAGAVGSVYGIDAQNQFSEMFKEHIVESNAIAIAVASGDENARAEANAELEEYLAEIATFFSTAIPVLPYDAVYGLLSEHEALINQSTEAAANGDFNLSYQLEAQALAQVSTIADALAQGIIATQPSMFK